MCFDHLKLALLPAITAHNIEEWIAIPYFRGELDPESSFAAQPWHVIELSLLLVTVVPVAIVIWASTGKQRRSKDWTICWIATIFLTNVFAPHIPSSIYTWGYTPGVATALIVLLPICASILRIGWREHRLTMSQYSSALILGVVSLPLAIATTFGIARVLT
ncbi:MAG: HXXEE domain-containing protein [Pseudomonadaceae bacterium]|nr:HXXEE domain-containing protein [Pseudomonadaceae bacterium]